MSQLSLETLDDASEELPRGLNAEIAPDDEMFEGNRKFYLRAGRSALRAITAALLVSGKGTPDAILDLPCGHGRVLRWLQTAFPNAELTACDLNRSGVDFCAKTFGAQPVYSAPHFETVRLPRQYDLIWCGSLLTHLDEAGWTGCLDLMQRSLAPDGLLVFTTRGRWVAERVRGEYASKGRGEPRFFGSYDETGLAFEPSAGQADYGNSLTSAAWVCERLNRLPNLKIVLLQERGWVGQQDVFACVRDDTMPAIPATQTGTLAQRYREQKAVMAELDRWAHDLEKTVVDQQAKIREYEMMLPVRIRRKLGK